MVSYRQRDNSLKSHSKRLKRASFTGVFKQVVFGASNLYNSPFFWFPTFTVPIEAGAPCTARDGFAGVLISDPPVLEPTLPNLSSAQ